MRVVVTGGAGFLGTHLCRHLADAGAAVRVLDRAPPPPGEGDSRVEFVDCDVRNRAAVGRGLGAADVVVHAAFSPPRAGVEVMNQVNVGGTENVCSEALERGVRRLILISSTVVDQPARSPGLLGGSALAQLDAYRSTRAAAEAVAARFADRGLEVAVVRPKTFVGPGRLGAFALVFDLIRGGAAVLLPGPGTNRYQLLDTRDFAAGLHLLAVAGGVGVFYFGAARFGTVADDLQALISHAGTTARLRPLPAAPVRAGLRAAELVGVAPFSEWYQCGARAHDSVVDISRATDELGWRPARSNEQSLVDAYDWYIDRLSGDGTAPTTHPVPRIHRILGRALGAVIR